ncbi:MAG TPA: hypothetical protein PLJ21_11020 [Pseudobdellovibrionaceae bacterium]|nr:hypothetical protein [Pseudobdellovibrionaceae bacterium]
MPKNLGLKMNPTTQLEFGIDRAKEQDRNYNLGGRSFYFFDFDDNIAVLATPLILFHKETHAEIQISSGEFANHHHDIGHRGIYENFLIDYDDHKGTFRNFRDHHTSELEGFENLKNIFIDDVAHALGFPDFHWKGPSWNCFYHAAFNQRPLSLITARGHNPETLREGIKLFVHSKMIPDEPNYIGIFPVNHKPTRQLLGDPDFTLSVPELKQRAIRESVNRALKNYGYSPHHRFGMSDDDPKNISMIIEEMTRLKTNLPEISFFVIETTQGQFIKHEITLNSLTSEKIQETDQLTLW